MDNGCTFSTSVGLATAEETAPLTTPAATLVYTASSESWVEGGVRWREEEEGRREREGGVGWREEEEREGEREGEY